MDIASMPKAELHRHLEGSIKTRTILDISRRKGLPLASFEEAELDERVKVKTQQENLQSVLDAFKILQTLFADYDAIEMVASRALEAAYSEENIKLLELRYSPSFMHCLYPELDWQKSLDIVLSCVDRFERSHAFVGGIIIIASRCYGVEAAAKTVDFAVRNKKKIIGFDFADTENDFPPRMFAAQGRRLAEEKIPVTVHSGEDGSPENILDSINILGARRIGHGIAASADKSGHLFSVLREKKITLETNPWSNYITRAVPELENHPLKLFLQSGLNVTIGADDPEALDTNLNKEYAICTEKMGLGEADLVAANMFAVEGSFLPQDKRQEAAKLLGFSGR